MWRTRTSQELWELYKVLDIVADIKKKGLESKGHLVRMDHRMVVKKTFESKPKGRRRMERPR